MAMRESGAHRCTLHFQGGRQKEVSDETENGTNGPRDHSLCHVGCPFTGCEGEWVLNVGCGRELRLHVEWNDRHAAGWSVCHGGPCHIRPDGNPYRESDD